MREQIRNIFNNAMGSRRGDIKEEFAKDVEGVVGEFQNDDKAKDVVRAELIKVSMETLRGLDELKKAYLHRKSLLNKIASEVSAQAAQDEKAGMKAHVMKMMQAIDDHMAKFVEDETSLNQEIELLKKKQI